MTDRNRIIEVLRAAEACDLISHMQPDGDSIGSLLAMGEGLRRLGKAVRMFAPNPVPRKYAFLQGADRVNREVEMGVSQVPLVVLDCSDPDRLGAFREALSAKREIINIDHHVTNHRFGTLNLVDSEASATGEIIYYILQELRVPFDRALAEALYVAIATDTGSFKYENTRPSTHRMAADLLEMGIETGELSQWIFDDHSPAFYLILRDALAGLEFYAKRRIAVMTLSRDLRLRSGAGSDDLEGIVNFTRNIEGVELGILFYVDSDREQEVKVGFRSRTLDVSALAGRLNGGGHARAAGCRLRGNFTEIRSRVIEEACAALREQENGL